MKNGIVPAAYFFARWDPSQSAHVQGVRPLLLEAAAVACFCAVASGIYLINDLRDREADRRHPVKRLRPLAAGEIQARPAGVVAVLLLAAGMAGALPLPGAFSAVLGGYLLMQLVYTFALKRIPYVDVFVIALGFVLRAIAGASVSSAEVSRSIVASSCGRRAEASSAVASTTVGAPSGAQAVTKNAVITDVARATVTDARLPVRSAPITATLPTLCGSCPATPLRRRSAKVQTRRPARMVSPYKVSSRLRLLD